jgi:hypothetical protein
MIKEPVTPGGKHNQLEAMTLKRGQADVASLCIGGEEIG